MGAPAVMTLHFSSLQSRIRSGFCRNALCTVRTYCRGCRRYTFERGVELGAAGLATYAVEVEFERFKSHAFEKRVSKGNDLDVRRGQIASVQFDAELMMFAKSAVLRSFVTEHGSEIIRFHRHNALRKAVFYERTRNARRTFGAQRHTSVSLVKECVHFLCHDVGGFADASLEKFGMLEHRSAYFLETEQRRGFARFAFDIVPFVSVFGQHILGALGD